MIHTLVVEDDPSLAEVHRLATERIPGFQVAAVAHLGSEALRILATQEIDLVLLDFYLPDMNGLEVCRTLRARGDQVDVIAVTSARDVAMVRSAVSLGIVHYLIKPFSFGAFREKLQAYAEYRRRTHTTSDSFGQRDVDQALSALREPADAELPKGLASETLGAIVTMLRTGQQLSAADISSGMGISRPTARRYLDYLTSHRLVHQEPRYGSAGRPEYVYTWSGPTESQPPL